MLRSMPRTPRWQLPDAAPALPMATCKSSALALDLPVHTFFAVASFWRAPSRLPFATSCKPLSMASLQADSFFPPGLPFM
ncbi:hypothetical protein F3B38_05465 [Janthinobacterium lividum]|nr:hypothetical protein F3B38_05465 [Janthinobacterium lividum]